MRVVLAQVPESFGQVQLVQFDRLVVAAQVRVGEGERVPCAHGLRMLGAEHPEPRLQGVLVQGGGLLELPAIGVAGGEVRGRDQREGMVAAKDAPPVFVQLLVERGCLGQPLGEPVLEGEVAAHEVSVRVVGADGFATFGIGLLIEVYRLRQFPRRRHRDREVDPRLEEEVIAGR